MPTYREKVNFKKKTEVIVQDLIELENLNLKEKLQKKYRVMIDL